MKAAVDARNTGDGCTCDTGDRHTALSARIDWISATFRNGAGVIERLKRAVCPTGMWRQVGGSSNYRKGERCGQVVIYHEGNNNTVWLRLSGSACDQVACDLGIHDEAGWQALFARLDRLGAKYNRIDFALDDRSGLLTLPRLIRKAERCEVVSRFRRASQMKEWCLKTRKRTGLTLIFGQANASEYHVRFYDKQLQATGIASGSGAHWLRVEVQAQHEHAVALAKAFAAQGFRAVSDDLAARLSFRSPKMSDANKSRWPVYRPWARFVGTTPKLIPTGANELTPSEKDEKFVHQNYRYLKDLSTDRERLEALLSAAEQLGNQRELESRPVSPPPTGIAAHAQAHFDGYRKSRPEPVQIGPWREKKASSTLATGES